MHCNTRNALLTQVVGESRNILDFFTNKNEALKTLHRSIFDEKTDKNVNNTIRHLRFVPRFAS